MNRNWQFYFILTCLTCWCITVQAQDKNKDTVHYSGNVVSNVDYHHGRLSPAVGVHNMQIFRANREHPELAEGFGFTYNHAPMLCYWNNTFYVEYLSDKVGESVPPGQTLVLTSKDGQSWTKPTVVFPQYKIPDGTTKVDHPGVAKDLYAVMHQRMGWYVSKSNRLLVLGFYGICLDGHDDPNDGEGVGRVVREVYPNGKYGPIYFIHYNPKWNEKNTSYPFYKTSKDKGFVDACDELMANPLMMMQWFEETDRKDPLIPFHKDYKAFNFYHLPDGRVVGLWKYALTSISTDNGKKWPTNAARAPHFVTANAKIWGQRTTDGKYATVYNPSEFRWPLAVSTSADGLNYTNLLLVNGEISTLRYGGAYKSYGPQYVRGIEEGNGKPPGNNMWVTYSMNKEDIWVSSIPVPVTDIGDHANDIFNDMPAGKELDKWNIYSPLWAHVGVEKMADGTKALALHDHDNFDYARAERIVPTSKRLTADFTIVAGQNNTGMLDIEFQNENGDAAIRLTLDSTGIFTTKAGYRNKTILKQYEANQSYHIVLKLNVDTRSYTLSVNDKAASNNLFFAPVLSVKRVVFRTGGVRRFPDADTPTDQNYDLPNAGESAKPAVFYIKSFKTSN